MSANANPYRAPSDSVGTDSRRDETGWFWGVWFWSGCVAVTLGFFANFTRNLPPLGFLLIGMLCFAGAAIGSRRYRKRSLVGLLITILLSAGSLYHLQRVQTQFARDRAMRARAEAQKIAEELRRAAEEAQQASQQQ